MTDISEIKDAVKQTSTETIEKVIEEFESLQVSTTEMMQGNLVVNYCTLVNTDSEMIEISNLVSSFQMYEDITKPFCSGRMTLVDGVNLLKNFKITGQESITISVSQVEMDDAGAPTAAHEDNSITKTFRIYSVTDVHRSRQQNFQVYVLHFVDPKQITCQRTKISKVLRNSYSEMLLQTLQEHADFKDLPESGTDFWEESEPQHMQIIVPNWNIMKLIKFICNNADYKGNKTWKNSMFFYQTLNGGFRFSSFQSMMQREFPIVFSYYPKQISSNQSNPNADGGLNTQILDIVIPQRNNTMLGGALGTYAGLVKAFDPVRKVEEESTYSISEVFERGEDGHVSGHPIIRTGQEELTYVGDDSEGYGACSVEHFGKVPDTDYESFVDYKVSMTNAFSDEQKLVDASDNKSITQQKGQEYRDSSHLERKALLGIFDQSRVNIKVPFRSDMSVGTCIQIDILEPEEDENGMPTVDDKMHDGKYLITRMAVIVDPQKGRGYLDLECVKESYGESLNLYQERGRENAGAMRYEWEEKEGEGDNPL